jgi:transcriptional regulator with XRE-family HTH domain
MTKTRATHITDPEGFRKRLLQAREAAGLSQRRLAFPGCSPAYICRIEAGDRLPSEQTSRKLAERLGVTHEWLVSGEEDGLFEAQRSLVNSWLRGQEISEELVETIDRLTLPDWYTRWQEWMENGGAYPSGVPNPSPDWAREHYLLRRRRERRTIH